MLNTTITSPKGSHGSIVQFDEAQTFDQLQDVLRINLKIGGTIYKFFGGLFAYYLRDIEDKDYSLSLNYFSVNREAININHPKEREDALTSLGKNHYQHGKNRYFGLTCGDYFITKYEHGAILVVSLDIHLSNHLDKADFVTELKTAFAEEKIGNIFEVAVAIEHIASKY